MSSLRLALKQSLADSGTLVNEEQKEKERKRKKELARSLPWLGTGAIPTRTARGPRSWRPTPSSE